MARTKLTEVTDAQPRERRAFQDEDLVLIVQIASDPSLPDLAPLLSEFDLTIRGAACLTGARIPPRSIQLVYVRPGNFAFALGALVPLVIVAAKAAAPFVLAAIQPIAVAMLAEATVRIFDSVRYKDERRKEKARNKDIDQFLKEQALAAPNEKGIPPPPSPEAFLVLAVLTQAEKEGRKMMVNEARLQVQTILHAQQASARIGKLGGGSIKVPGSRETTVILGRHTE